jgi:hypothetical protein
VSSMLLRLPLCSCGYWQKSNGLWAGQRPGGRRYLLAAELGFSGLGSCLRERLGGKGRNSSALPQVTGLALSRREIARVFEFTPLNSAPGRIRTCAHGSGGECSMTLLPGGMRRSRRVGERMGSAKARTLLHLLEPHPRASAPAGPRIVVTSVVE